MKKNLRELGEVVENTYTGNKSDSYGRKLTKNNSACVTLLSYDGKMYSMWLPPHMEGRYTFNNTENNEDISSFYAESLDGYWELYCTRGMFFHNGLQIGHNISVEDGVFYKVYFGNREYTVYVEYENEYSNIFHPYYIERSGIVQIGRLADCDICYPSNLVSRKHATLKWLGNKWEIEDTGSLNGIYVNGKKVKRSILKLGDVIYIMGLRIIMGAGFVSINDGNNRIKITSYRVRRITSTSFDTGPLSVVNKSKTDNLFNRAPRKRFPLNPQSITIDAPPMSLHSNSIPMLLRMGAPMVMSSASLLTGNYTAMLSSVLFPILTQKYSDKQKKEYEDRRYEKYTEYLQAKQKEILTEKETEEFVLRANYPEFSEIITYTEKKERLWERRKNDDDFLTLRIGNGRYPMLASIEYPARGFVVDDDPLMEQMYQLAEPPIFLENVPVLTSLIDNNICGVLGDRSLVFSFVRQLIMQLTLLHSYDEVKIVILTEENELKQFEFVKYLPHIWNDQRDFRFLATSSSDALQIGEVLKRDLEEDLKKPKELKDIMKVRPYYIVFAFSKRIFDNLEILKDVMQLKNNCGMSILAIFDDLPKECTQIFNLNMSGEHDIIHLRDIDKQNEVFKLDSIENVRSEQAMKAISNTYLKLITQEYSLPSKLSFLEMFGVGRVEHLNPLERWKNNDPVKSLSTPIGVMADGSLFTLDLHEKHQGPHGLVAGMTGSGKSEFLITYILSMAINYHPNEVAFILIDYKGGGLAGAFEDEVHEIHLPHLVGTITNLDGASIQRSLISLQSELTRRQRVFNEAKTISEEGTMDIYKYQKLYRNGQVSEPMPHLFIISDEFAELKQQQPEFLDKLVSVARIGRSLGVHLILATQKPAGVVDEQIRSNTKFRVCLKVQDRSDSFDMLKRYEAAELKDTGRFYLQVGYNEYFALGQSAWSGADYYPQDEVYIQKDDNIHFIGSVGQNVHIAKHRIEKKSNQKSQLVSIVKMLSDVAKRNGILRKSLWMPQLPNSIKATELFAQNHKLIHPPTEILLGLIDDPENQTQFPFVYDFKKSRNLMIVGESASGKTTLIQTILFSLIKSCTPEELNLYILDYSSRTMKIFKSLPHCGAVLYDEDSDSLDNFFNVINGIVEERKQTFSKLDVNSYEAANTISPIPLVLVVIDGISLLSSSKIGREHVYQLSNYLKESTNYGIKYIISCNHLNELASAVKYEIGDRITFRMKDKYAYSEALKCKTSYVPPELPGRGLCNFNGRALEFQSAIIYDDIDFTLFMKQAKLEIIQISNKYQASVCAKRLPIISEDATYEEFAGQFSLGRIPLGYSLISKKAVALPLKQFHNLSVYFGNPDGIVPIFENLLFAANREQMDIYIVRRSKQSCFDHLNSNGVATNLYSGAQLIESDQKQIQTLWKTIVEEVKERRIVLQNYCTLHNLDENQEDIMQYAFRYVYDHTKPLFILIENLADFCLSSDIPSSLVFERIIQTAKKRNIYFVAGFEPDDYKLAEKQLVYYSFISNSDVLLLGGNLDKQRLCEIQNDSANFQKQFAYNVGIMEYRKKYHPILMPCGEIQSLQADEDDLDIF